MDQVCKAAEIEPLVVSPAVACRMLGCSANFLYGLIGAGEIESYLDGRARRVVVASIRAYVARRSQEGVAA